MSSGRPPSVPGRYPLVGHTLSLLGDPLNTIEQWAAAGDGLVRARVAGRRVVLVSAPGPARQILASDSTSYRKAEVVRQRLGTLQGGSLVLLEGDQWRQRRGVLRSGFDADRLDDAAAVATDYASETVRQWPTDAPVRADEHARDLSLSILARALFGLDLRGGRTPIHDAADDILGRMDLRSVSAYLPEWVPTPANRRFRRAVETLHARLDATVDARADEAAASTDLLSTMLAAGLPAEVIRDELIALLFAGFDSTATALSCTLALLADNPDEQAALAAELDTALSGDRPTPAHLDDLDRLDAVVRESLRLFPPQYLLFREPTEDVTLEGYAIEAGTTLAVAPWVLHRDEQHWTDPDEFRPARWLNGDGTDSTDRPAFSYVPYGGGPRRCLGRTMADRTLELVVAVVCRRRRLHLVDEFTVAAGPTLSLDGGVTLLAPRRS